MVVHRLTQDAARRIAIHAQLLDVPRPTDLVDVVDRLTILQIDPTAAIAPSADLVLWSRLGSTYDPSDLTNAIERDRTLVETVAYIRPPRDLPAVIAEVREAAMHPNTAAWLEKNEPFRRDIIVLLEKEVPLLSRDIPDTCVVPWAVVRLDQQPQHHQDARDPRAPRSGGDLGPQGAPALLGPA
jgi:uncharacterized protein YcaQ